MSMGVSGPKGKSNQKPEINVTPLVDVMLVLLVIFMITIQAAKESIPMELPEAKGNPQDDKGGMEISLDADGRVHAGSSVLELTEIDEEFPRLLHGREKEVLTLNAHRKLTYDKVVKVIAAIRSAGVETINISVDGAGPGPIK